MTSPSPEFSYFPGCSAHGTAAEYDLSARAACTALDVSLVELPDWNCCGASSAHAVAPELAVRLAGRNVELARRVGRDLVVGCAACFNRLRAAGLDMRRARPAAPLDIEVRSLPDVLSEEEVLHRLRSRLVAPLDGLAVVPYYGCLLVRPPEVTGAPDPEDPKSLDRILGALGADVRTWPYKTRCCGGGLSVPCVELVRELCAELAGMARRARARLLVTACPMCFANLDTRQPSEEEGGAPPVPVAYFTELMALAMDLPGVTRLLGRHLTPVTPLLSARGRKP